MCSLQCRQIWSHGPTDPAILMRLTQGLPSSSLQLFSYSFTITPFFNLEDIALVPVWKNGKWSHFIWYSRADFSSICVVRSKRNSPSLMAYVVALHKMYVALFSSCKLNNHHLSDLIGECFSCTFSLAARKKLL